MPLLRVYYGFTFPFLYGLYGTALLVCHVTGLLRVLPDLFYRFGNFPFYSCSVSPFFIGVQNVHFTGFHLCFTFVFAPPFICYPTSSHATLASTRASGNASIESVPLESRDCTASKHTVSPLDNRRHSGRGKVVQVLNSRGIDGSKLSITNTPSRLELPLATNTSNTILGSSDKMTPNQQASFVREHFSKHQSS